MQMPPHFFVWQVGVGRAIAASGIAREDLFITTKIPGCGLQGVSRAKCGPDSVRDVETNLRQLNVSYIDLLLVHFPPIGGCGALNCGVIQSQWQALEALVAKKQVRALRSPFFWLGFTCVHANQISAKRAALSWWILLGLCGTLGSGFCACATPQSRPLGRPDSRLSSPTQPPHQAQIKECSIAMFLNSECACNIAEMWPRPMMEELPNIAAYAHQDVHV